MSKETPSSVEYPIATETLTDQPEPKQCKAKLSYAWNLVVLHLLKDMNCMNKGSRSFATPSVVARRLLALAFTCKDMHSVVISHGFPAMATEVTEFVAKFLQCTSDREAEGVRNLRELLEFLNSITEERRQGIAALLSQAWNGEPAQIPVQLAQFFFDSRKWEMLCALLHHNNMEIREAPYIPSDVLKAVRLEKMLVEVGKMQTVLLSLGTGKVRRCITSVFTNRMQLSEVHNIYDGEDVERAYQQALATQQRLENERLAAGLDWEFCRQSRGPMYYDESTIWGLRIGYATQRLCLCGEAPAPGCKFILCTGCCHFSGADCDLHQA